MDPKCLSDFLHIRSIVLCASTCDCSSEAAYQGWLFETLYNVFLQLLVVFRTSYFTHYHSYPKAHYQVCCVRASRRAREWNKKLSWSNDLVNFGPTAADAHSVMHWCSILLKLAVRGARHCPRKVAWRPRITRFIRFNFIHADKLINLLKCTGTFRTPCSL